MTNGKLTDADWAKIKIAWIEKKLSVKAIARKFGVSDTAIRKHAKAKNWPVRPSQPAQTRGPNCEPNREQERTTHKDEPRVPPLFAVSQSSDPKDLVRAGRAIIEMLIQELAWVTSNLDLLEQIIIEETAGAKSSRRRQMLMRIVSLPMRTQAARNLASALSTLSTAGPGKKEAANDAAAEVGGNGSVWGDDLDPGGARPN